MTSLGPKFIRVGAAALNQTPMAWEENKTNIIKALEAARSKQVSLLCFPELCITGYNCEDAFLSYSLVETGLQVLHEILPHTKGLVAAVGLPLLHNKALFNTAALLADGQILGFVAKQNLAGYGIHYEPRWFKAWPVGSVTEFALGSKRYPLGDIYFDLSGVRIGFEICEDAWAANRPGRDLSRRAIDILLNPSASHFAFGKQEVRERFVLEGSRAFGVCYIYSNLLGCEAGRAIYDGAIFIASSGKALLEGRRFSFEPFQLEYADVDLGELRMQQAQSAGYSPKLGTDDQQLVRAEFAFHQDMRIAAAGKKEPSWEGSQSHKHEEFCRAVSLALFDYMRKSRSHGFVVSLSGGADSSAVCSLVYLMVEFALKELGLEELKKRLSYISTLSSAKSAKQIVENLLTCAYLSTRNSSETTLKSARELAQAIGAVFHCFEVDKLVDEYQKLVSGALGRKLSWEQDDLALQNIQARARAPAVWFLANLKRALLLSTSNRSEAAVGYATMDGDTCGGLSPIAGIDKAYLREWLVWMEKTGPFSSHSLPILKLVNQQQPTAELRPSASKQTDEDDLMPYIVLDYIEKLAIRDKKVPLEVFLSLQRDFSAKYPAEKLKAWVFKFFRLWCANQWKRERYAPSFHLDDENLDPKTWCRFPILSGGYERELLELENHCVREGIK